MPGRQPVSLPVVFIALRLDIVFYDEVHFRADEITDIKTHDLLYGNPDVLLIFGTSLHIKGTKEMVKQPSSVVHNRAGIVVYVNLTALRSKGRDGVIDYRVKRDRDS
ncbi:putative hst3p protein [Eutypa lata UCREL1]|uniref:Putative hst3p protein n=1 Tax=Eutypa lata (strain UCR-EL1) TaxID=1287681 RepID=M7SZ39_EUTLA|nr:putative hst3p protein [Eutypa lata UCREL1]